jgi:hypothetical protein
MKFGIDSKGNNECLNWENIFVSDILSIWEHLREKFTSEVLESNDVSKVFHCFWPDSIRPQEGIVIKKVTK